MKIRLTGEFSDSLPLTPTCGSVSRAPHPSKYRDSEKNGSRTSAKPNVSSAATKYLVALPLFAFSCLQFANRHENPTLSRALFLLSQPWCTRRVHCGRDSIPGLCAHDATKTKLHAHSCPVSFRLGHVFKNDKHLVFFYFLLRKTRSIVLLQRRWQWERSSHRLHVFLIPAVYHRCRRSGQQPYESPRRREGLGARS